MQDERNLAWLDLEMTGLEPEKDLIMEIATIVTDSELRVLADEDADGRVLLDPVRPVCVAPHVQ